jgi:TonB-dependent receptor
MKKSYGMLLAGSAAFAIALAAPAYAQTADDEAPGVVQDEGGTIVVTGLRSSIGRALEEKRGSGEIVEIVNAEAIGKLPDQNVAEAIGRVTGVNVARKDGEGSSFTVRGLSLNRVEINGRSFVGPTQDATPALETVNPEIFAGIEVAKSPSASRVEGAIGATINLKTRRPLDVSRNLYSGRIQGVYSDKIEKTGFRASGLVSLQTSDGTLGVLAGVAYGRIYSMDEGITTNGWVRTNNIDGNNDGVNDTGLFRPNRMSSQIQRRKDDRLTLNGAFQWRPDENTELVIESTYSRFDRKRDLNYYQLLLNDNDVAGSTRVLSDGTVTGATLTGITLRPLAYDAPSLLKSFNVGASFTHRTGPLTIKADTSYSSGQGSENQAGLSTGAPFTYVIVPRSGFTTNVSYDFAANRNFPNYSLQTNFNQNDPASYQLFSVFDGEAISKNRGYDGRVDLTYDVGGGILKNVMFGARYENIRLQSSDPQSTPGAAALLAAADKNGDGIITLNELPAVSYANQFSGSFLPEVDGNFPRNFLTGDVLSVALARQTVGLGAPGRQPASERQVDQRSLATYLQFNFEGDIGVPVHANIGMRYVNTRRLARGNEVATGPGGTTVTPTAFTRTFNDWLPSANVAFDLTESLVFRLAASKVVARPALRDVAPGITVSLTNFTAASGNPNLDPIRADQFDAALEWYFAPSSLLNVALFRKNLSTFIVPTTTSTTLAGYPPTAVNPSGLFQLSRPANGTGGQVQGVEVGYQHALRFLPKPFDGLGVSVNYTYADSKTPIADPLGGGTLPLVNLSRDTVNVVGYYEDSNFTVRVAYTYRSKFLVSVDSIALGGAKYQDAYGQLDASASVTLIKGVRLTFDATNITKQFERQYNGTSNRLTLSVVNDTRYSAGVSLAF